MRSREYHCSYGCPVEATLDVIGGKWKGVILYDLLEEPKRFGELRRRLPSITQRMLTHQLRELESDGLVHREVFREVPPKVEYSLTEFGRSLESILLLMRDWGAQYSDLIRQRRENSGTLVDEPSGTGDPGPE